MTNNLRCKRCNKEFRYESEKKRHELSHSPRFKCGVCYKKFSFNSALKRHEKQHQRTEKVQCKQCSRSFRDESLLKRHIKYAHKGKYTCIKCYAEFNSELALSTHEKTHNAKSERRYQCGYDGCGKTFNFPHHLKHHEMTHTNTKQYYCHICKKGFIQFHHFKSHMKTHDQDKWLRCIEINCKKTFPTEASKKRHLLHVHNIKSSDKSTAKSEQIKTEFKYDVEIDKVLCTVCGKIINVNIFDEHQSQCSPACKENSGCLSETKVEGQEHTQINYDNNPHISDCKSALGSCIVDGDSSENCLCAQIKTTVDDFYENTIIPDENINSTNIQSNLQQFESNKSINNENVNEACKNCACSGNVQRNFNSTTGICTLSTGQRNIEDRNCSSRNNLTINLPDIEYKLDGSIKLKDTFDADIKVFESTNAENQEKKKIEIYNSYYVPFNSCKAVLGKCIVSSNGMISDECLCAKMLVDEQHVTAEEIDEITPHPASTTYLSVI